MSNVTNEVDCCVFCLMPKNNEVILTCKHSFCFDCMQEYCKLVNFYRRCPVCRKAFTYYEVVNGNPLQVVVVDDEISESEDNDSSEFEYESEEYAQFDTDD